MPTELPRFQSLQIRDLPPDDSLAGMDAPMTSPDSDDTFRGGVVLVISASAFSGAVMGFFLAGAFKLSIAVFIAGILGAIAGWWASKLAQLVS